MIVSDLPLVTAGDRARILAADRTSDAHRELLASLPAMNAVQTGGKPRNAALVAPITVAAWNMERCLFPQASAARLADVAPQVVLLSEVDHGMARTGQRHTAAEMAEAMGMCYAFSVEFHELGLGGETERRFCIDDHNVRGWHGNAILSAVPFDDLCLIRLDDHGHWFTADYGADPGQPRVGGRIAIAALIDGVCFVTTHLESNSGAEHRAAQFDLLMDAIDRFAPDCPVVIGGDLNTGNHMPPDFDWRMEPLFGRAEARGYDWSMTADGMTTRPSLITPHPTREMKLDWLGIRGLNGVQKGKLDAIDPTGRVLSDHDAVWCAVQ